jgi:hypothetical protein
LDAANAVLAKPATINGAALSASEFATGYLVDGPYEPTPAGAIGFGFSAIEKYTREAGKSEAGGKKE